MENRTLTREETTMFLQYVSQHEIAFRNPIIQSFFSHVTHVIWLVRAMHGHLPSQARIEHSFRQHVLQLRLVSYLASVIHYSTVSFIRSTQKVIDRNPLIMDHSSSDEDSRNSADALLFQYLPSSDMYFMDHSAFADHIEDEQLYGSFRSLTAKQRQIVLMSYVQCYRDTEIAQTMHVSPQAVFKSRQKALDKLRSSILSKGVKQSG
ncbi:RNA polymerase sigma factor (sigma-70 family) [Paenibacillus shirakamiensis]|uniref:RNA polymerase sigma factor (Sigma-70 family) n=1 Tax=Paenibacillus shirakamiensis TaxID=1265935 RepID=A0ABS4JG94_9BACL|nr:sigma-70 family RNA polymerase sigma factor [Paenibacillus shirakamiensis]MBP2000745.1 RNA polymerase sigma factor (sigma-70 family) [Paenibacillus shirakamiensis]